MSSPNTRARACTNIAKANYPPGPKPEIPQHQMKKTRGEEPVKEKTRGEDVVKEKTRGEELVKEKMREDVVKEKNERKAAEAIEKQGKERRAKKLKT